MYSVLIVEDEPLMRQYLLNNLSLIHPEFQVVNVARNGKEAVSVLEKTAFDLIITDIQMPGMDGLSFVKQLRDAGSGIPVIILTGYDEFEYARAGLRLGVAEYLLKPLNDSELCRVLEAIKGKIETKRNSVYLPDSWTDESIRDFLSRCFSGTNPNSEQANLSERAAAYISSHFTEPITQADVADALGITPAYLSSIFHEEKGESYTKFLTRLRMIQSAMLLKSNPDLTISAIAEQCGYLSDKHFISVFKKFFGTTPNEYRKQGLDT